jgi:hypothetical protein
VVVHSAIDVHDLVTISASAPEQVTGHAGFSSQDLVHKYVTRFVLWVNSVHQGIIGGSVNLDSADLADGRSGVNCDPQWRIDNEFS